MYLQGGRKFPGGNFSGRIFELPQQTSKVLDTFEVCVPKPYRPRLRISNAWLIFSRVWESLGIMRRTFS